MCTLTGNIKKDGVITNLISEHGTGCVGSSAFFTAVDSRSVRNYYWSIERFVFDRDQNNMKAIGLPIDSSGNPYAAGPEN